MKSQQKICFIISDYNPKTATHHRYLHDLIAIVAQHMQVCVLVENPHQAISPESPLAKYLVVQKQRNSLLRAIEELWLLFKLHLKGYRLFYVHQAKYGAILSSIITKLLGGRTFFWHCGEVLKFISVHPTSLNPRAIHTWINGWLAMKVALAWSHYLVTGNQLIANTYISGFNLRPEKIRLLPNYVNPQEFQKLDRASARQVLGLPEASFIILFVHSLAINRGADRLVNLAQTIKNQIPDSPVLFLAVGDGYYRHQLETDIERNNLGEVFRLVGNVPNTDIHTYYVASDLFIMPSMAEGFPRVIIEAMAAGVPTITTDVGGIPEILEDMQQDFMISVDDPHDFAEKTIYLMEHPAIRQELIALGYQVVQKYTFDKAVERFMAMVSQTPMRGTNA